MNSNPRFIKFIDQNNKPIIFFLFKNPQKIVQPVLPKKTDLADHISTDHIITVADLLTDDYDELGDRVLCGMPTEFGIIRGTVKKNGYQVIVAGDAFGIGSSREQAVTSLLAAGIKLVIAGSFGPIFAKNAVNLGLLISTDYKLIGKVRKGEQIPLSVFEKGKDKLTRDIIRSGSLFNYLDYINHGKISRPVVRKSKTHPMNVWEKRLTKLLNIKSLNSEDTVLIPVHQAYSYVALSGPARQALVSAFGKVQTSLDPERIHLFEDHFAYSTKPEIKQLTINQRQFAKELKIPTKNYYFGKVEEGGGTGISHRVMLENVNPIKTRVVIATDSHTPTLGALPIIAIPVGSTFFAAALATNNIPLTVGEVLRINFTGKLPAGMTIRDVQLELATIPRKSNGNATVIEFGGPGLNTLSFDQVAALCNMVPEIFQGDIAVCESFTSGIKYLNNRHGIPEKKIQKLYGVPDPKCKYAEVINFDLSHASPWIARPGRPSDAVELSELKDHPQIHKVYLASCTNGLNEIREVAAVLNHKKVHQNSELIVVPSSINIRKRAQELGYFKILENAGAKVRIESVCSVCMGDGPDAALENQTVISATNRNFHGRMGHPTSKVYLGGSILTALSAQLGHIPTIEEYHREIPRIIRNLEQLSPSV
jgi:3-isopropylmalate/(R)-2-methylmalate dehydratase large subunit